MNARYCILVGREKQALASFDGPRRALLARAVGGRAGRWKDEAMNRIE